MQPFKLASTFLISSLLMACTQVHSQPTGLSAHNQTVLSALLQSFTYWKGTPYRFGGNSKKGIDCSALIQRTFLKQFNYPLPRTTKYQANAGTPVTRASLKAGDLVFFKTGYQSRHAGIYLDKGRFMHASTSQGVIISRLDNPYWQRKYWKSIRPQSPLKLSSNMQ